MYYFVLCVLITFSAIEVLTGKRSERWFNVSYLLMTFMATFRYGQMDDYFNYYINYEHPEIYGLIDPLFGLLIGAFKAFSIGYPVFIALLSFICMLLSYRFFYKDCGYSCISLLLFYGYTFMLCPMSSIRQGICLALLMFMFPWLKEKKNKRFYFWVIVGCFIHLSFIVCLILPFLLNLKIYNKTYIIYMALGLTAFAIVGISVTAFLPIDRLATYQEGEGASVIVRMALRILIILPVFLFYPDEETDGYYAKAICLIGYAMYCVLSFNDLVAGRLEFYFRSFMSLYAAFLVQNYIRTSRMMTQLGALVVLHVFLWFKSVDAGIDRMYYREGITALNFPYISVFNKAELKEYSGIDTFGLE